MAAECYISNSLQRREVLVMLVARHNDIILYDGVIVIQLEVALEIGLGSGRLAGIERMSARAPFGRFRPASFVLASPR